MPRHPISMVKLSVPIGRKWLSMLEGGVRLDAYCDKHPSSKCPVECDGVWTIGVGSTYWPDSGEPVRRGDRIATNEIADTLFSEVLKDFESGVSDAIEPNGILIRSGGPLVHHVTDALIAFCFNIGVPRFKKSTAISRFNKNFPMSAVADAMSWYKNPGLKSRRDAEIRCLIEGVYSDQSGKKLTIHTNGV